MGSIIEKIFFLKNDEKNGLCVQNEKKLIGDEQENLESELVCTSVRNRLLVFLVDFLGQLNIGA